MGVRVGLFPYSVMPYSSFVTPLNQWWLLYNKGMATLEKRFESAWKKLSTARKYTPDKAIEAAPLIAGVYCIWRGKKLVYAGETALLKRRMKNLQDTRNHTFRRKVGYQQFHLQPITASEKFSKQIEIKLTSFFRKNYKISFLKVPLGRKELEEYIITNKLLKKHGAKK